MNTIVPLLPPLPRVNRAARYLLPLLLVVLSALPAYGSSLIVMRNNAEMVIGTDSKRLRTAREDLNDARSELACKIIRADNIFITTAGLTGIAFRKGHRDIPTEFDLTEIIRTTALGEGSLPEKADVLAKTIDNALLKMYAWMKDRMPALFRQTMLGKEAAQVLMAGTEHETPVFVVMTFQPSLSPSGELEIQISSRPCPGTACPSGSVYLFMGRHEAIDRYLHTNPDIWTNDPVDVVRELLETEVASDPESVGPPLDILRITKEGSEWIQEKDMCEDHSRSHSSPHSYSPGVSP